MPIAGCSITFYFLYGIGWHLPPAKSPPPSRAQESTLANSSGVFFPVFECEGLRMCLRCGATIISACDIPSPDAESHDELPPYREVQGNK